MLGEELCVYDWSTVGEIATVALSLEGVFLSLASLFTGKVTTLSETASAGFTSAG
jgi:hypothetical protein